VEGLQCFRSIRRVALVSCSPRIFLFTAARRVARQLRSPPERQRLLNQARTAEALTKEYLVVLHDLRTSSNLVLMVPTEGVIPMLNLGRLEEESGQVGGRRTLAPT
jgi:hypothetical protein